MGYAAGVEAYQRAAASLTAQDLSQHYTQGLAQFHDEFVPHLKRRLSALTDDVWQLDDFVAYAAGSDVDLMAHIVEAADGAAIFPSDWYGFLVGSARQDRISFDTDPGDRLACLCVPSVRNGHVTQEMISFLQRAERCLLNINLFPTLRPTERAQVAQALKPVLDKALLSISFSRGFGLTASQLGVVLVHRDHPMRKRFDTQWKWFTYFYNALAARAFMAIDLERLEREDRLRRDWVHRWCEQRGLPALQSGSYYVRSFRVQEGVEALAEPLSPLVRGDVVRLCMKPTI